MSEKNAGMLKRAQEWFSIVGSLGWNSQGDDRLMGWHSASGSVFLLTCWLGSGMHPGEARHLASRLLRHDASE